MFAISLLSLVSPSPSPEAVLAKAQPTCEAIVVALTEFHRRHGRYPEDLGGLVKENLLAEAPKLPSHWGASSAYGPRYEVNTSLDFYRVSFGYHIPEGIGPGDTHWRVFVSDDPKGWESIGTPHGMEDLVADRLTATFRLRHDGKSLDLFMSNVIGKADCKYLYRDRVTRWLGEGEEIDVPPDAPAAGKKGDVYRAQDGAGKWYCLVFKDHWLSYPRSSLPADERSKYPDAVRPAEDAYVDKTHPVLDKLFLIQEADGRPSWTVLRECPESPNDKPSHPVPVRP